MAPDGNNGGDGNSKIPALKMMREDSTKTLEYTFQKHGEFQKKSTQMIQLNGVIISLLLAASTQITLNCVILGGGAFFLFSALAAGYALRGTTLDIGISVDQTNHILDEKLSEEQYLLWYFREYYPQAFSDLNEKTSNRAHGVQASVYSFLAGVVMIAGGIVIQLPG